MSSDRLPVSVRCLTLLLLTAGALAACSEVTDPSASARHAALKPALSDIVSAFSTITEQSVSRQQIGTAPQAEWVVYTLNGGNGLFVSGPATTPLGSGSFHMLATGADDQIAIATFPYINWPGLTGLSYSTFTAAGSGQEVPVLYMYVEEQFSGNPPATIVFDPRDNPDQGTVISGVWQTWDALGIGPSGDWGNAIWTFTTPEGSTIKLSLLSFFQDFLFNGFIKTVGLRRSGTGASLDAWVDRLVINYYTSENTYDFEAAANTPVGNDVSVSADDPSAGSPAPVSVTFANVSQAGLTTARSSSIGTDGSPPPPSNFRLGDPPTYYDVSTTASFSGPIAICFTYSSEAFGSGAELQLLHYSAVGNRWENVTTSMNSSTHQICGSAASLSPFLVAEVNLAASVTAITLPNSPMALGQTANLSAHFVDPNSRDTHSANISWDDGLASTPGTVNESLGSGNVSAQRTYTQAGVYEVGVSVSDGQLTGTRTTALDVPSFIVIYDPNGGFVTGGGWITSTVGAYAPDPSLSGRAAFGFVSKYQKGTSIPKGNTEFQFQAGSFNFSSTAYQWLVVAGAKAQYKGEGTVNGQGGYAFLLTATDGGAKGGNGVDQFRIKVWNKQTSAVIYDNVRSAGDDIDSANPQAIGGGSITIQR